MIDVIPLILSLLAGALLGLVFFGGLWLTVSKGVSSRYPFLWFLGSLLLRTAIVVAGFYYVTGGQFLKLLACLAGFIVVRFLILHKMRKPSDIPLEDHD